tara:strand:- start:1404 stop:1595 length:192 start_codon:yes stop_codon:yes gene_type:complete
MQFTVRFDGCDTTPAKMVARHNGQSDGNRAVFNTLDDYKAFLAAVQRRADVLCDRKGIPRFKV